MRRTVLSLVAVSVVLVGAAACGDDAEVRTGDEPTSSTVSTKPDGGTAEVAISIVTGGGFVPFGADFATVPTVVLTDGTAYFGGVTTQQFPGPAMAPVATGVIEPARMQDLLDEAAESGLTGDEPLDPGRPHVTDTPTTTITVRADGRTHTNSIYAPNMGSDDIVGAPLGLTHEQIAVRNAMNTFVLHVADATGAVGFPDIYAPDAFQVLAQPAGDADPSVPPNRLDWPFSSPLESGECLTVEGDDAATFAELLPQATQITVWTDPATRQDYNLIVRAVLPGFDRGCGA